MSQKYYTILTKLGAELLANATVLGTPLKLTQIAVGDANGSIPNPIATQTSLVHEVRRAAINTLFVDKDNPNQLIAEQVIPETEGGWFIHEIGLYDDKGNLIAVGNCPSTYKPKLVEGSARTQVIRMVIVIDDVNAVELKIDPSVVLATRQYVDELITTKMANHEKSTNHPNATTKSKGFVQLNSATNSTAENQAATPLAIKTVNDNANSRVPNIRKINNKMLNNDILLQADDINALPAFRKIINNEPIYEVGEQTNFVKRPKANNSYLLTFEDFSYEVSNGIIILRRADGLILQYFKAVYNGVNGANGTVVSLPITFPNNFYFAITSDGDNGCHVVTALPNDLTSVKMWGKVGDIYVDSLLQIVAVGR
ncbi:hypothetical protein A9G11_03095 [Gilliamella sp. wkB108]|uniref:phage tail protein n=1 Tax=Gilliamella sp. wkB108 TaxID=3120256 RepID=UPI00080E758E|nr:phage tail protein [Gilliamella apicola]OCG24654.1 hypothetical protein A9G11_03095 [Gilliamella apicola]